MNYKRKYVKERRPRVSVMEALLNMDPETANNLCKKALELNKELVAVDDPNNLDKVILKLRNASI